MRFVSNWSEIAQNIKKIVCGLESKNEEVREYFKKRISLGKCFVVAKYKNQTVFAPSRFIGYAENSKDKHQKNDDKDGRKTNPVIERILNSKWSENPKLDKQYENYRQSLNLGLCGSPRKYIDAQGNEII